MNSLLFLNFRCGGGRDRAGRHGVDDSAYASVCIWSVGEGGWGESVCDSHFKCVRKHARVSEQ